MTIRIYGAGMAGLLAANMLRRARPVISEAQQALPDNHGALLRFRTDAVARETGIEFRRVHVLKAVKSGGRLRTTSTIADANQYSHKVTQAFRPRSVLDLAPCDRYVAPDHFINTMARDAILKMNCPLTTATLAELKGQREISAISTIPMPALMRIVGWPSIPSFQFRPIWSLTVNLGPLVDVFQTIYYPEPDTSLYRASITGSRLILEWVTEPTTVMVDLFTVLHDFGMQALEVAEEGYHVKQQQYGKLLPINNDLRREFIMAMTDEYNIYSVGRFATWRQILLDDVVQDVQLVSSMIMQRNAYKNRLIGASR